MAVGTQKHPTPRRSGPHRVVGTLPATAGPGTLLRCAAISPVANEPFAVQHGAGMSKSGGVNLGRICAVQPARMCSLRLMGCFRVALAPSELVTRRRLIVGSGGKGGREGGAVCGAAGCKPPRCCRAFSIPSASPAGVAVCHAARRLLASPSCGPSRWPPKGPSWWCQGGTSGTVTNSLLSAGPALS